MLLFILFFQNFNANHNYTTHQNTTVINAKTEPMGHRWKQGSLPHPGAPLQY